MTAAYERRQADIRRARNRGWAVFWGEYTADAAFEAHQILNSAQHAIERGDAYNAWRTLARVQRSLDGARRAARGQGHIEAPRQELIRRFDELKARIKGWPRGRPPAPDPVWSGPPERDPPPPEVEREEREMGRRIRVGLAREERQAARAIDELERVRRGKR